MTSQKDNRLKKSALPSSPRQKMTARELVEFMESQRNEQQREILMRFFKTGPGQYGEGDAFLGLKVPQTREVVKAAATDFPIDEVPALLLSCWHEVRLCGLLILVAKFEKFCTWKTLQQGDSSWCLRYAEKHLHHPHDLMHKAVGWMLREMGKRISVELLRDFLQLHAHEMPRTMLRYAIEQLGDEERKMWMGDTPCHP